MNSLMELIGEDSINMALKNFFNEYKFSEKYPLPEDLLAYYKASSPDSLHATIDVMYNEIAFFDHSISNGSVAKKAELYEVSLSLTIASTIVTEEGEKSREMDYPLRLVFYDLQDRVIARYNITSTSNDFAAMLKLNPAYSVIDPDYIYIEKNRSDNRFEF